MMIKTEEEFKKMLRQISNSQIKKMYERVDVSNYPILLLNEYSRRFGLKKDNSTKISNIAKQLLKEKKKRIDTLKILKAEIKNLPDYYITQSGLNSLSTKSIDSLQQKSKITSSQILKTSIQLQKINTDIARLEKIYLELRS
jgi:hypothetical protein